MRVSSPAKHMLHGEVANAPQTSSHPLCDISSSLQPGLLASQSVPSSASSAALLPLSRAKHANLESWFRVLGMGVVGSGEVRIWPAR
jgi:hypothetical protein